MSRSLRAQIEEVGREIRLRKEVYPRQVAKRKLRQAEADEHLARMVAVLETLRLHEELLAALPEVLGELKIMRNATVGDRTKAMRSELIERLEALLSGETA